MTHFDDCAGVGGFALAAQTAGGIETRWAREHDDYARAVYTEHFPAVRLFRDVREPLPNLGPVGLYTCGFPCQPVSVAGKRKGKADERWLWPWIADTIRHLRPHYVLLENVPGLLAWEPFAEVLASLAALGYDAEWQVLSAAAFGALHLRKRVWVVAYPQRAQWGADSVARGVFGQNGLSQREEGTGRVGASGADVAYTERTRWRQGASVFANGRGSSEFERCGADVAYPQEQPRDSDGTHGPYQTEKGGLESRRSGAPVADANAGRYGPSNAAVFAGRPRFEPASWWDAEPNVGRVAHGIPRRVDRLRCLGNAIVPQVAAWIMRCIVAADVPEPPRCYEPQGLNPDDYAEEPPR